MNDPATYAIRIYCQPPSTWVEPITLTTDACLAVKTLTIQLVSCLQLQTPCTTMSVLSNTTRIARACANASTVVLLYDQHPLSQLAIHALEVALSATACVALTLKIDSRFLQIPLTFPAMHIPAIHLTAVAAAAVLRPESIASLITNTAATSIVFDDPRSAIFVLSNHRIAPAIVSVSVSASVGASAADSMVDWSANFTNTLVAVDSHPRITTIRFVNVPLVYADRIVKDPVGILRNRSSRIYINNRCLSNDDTQHLLTTSLPWVKNLPIVRCTTAAAGDISPDIANIIFATTVESFATSLAWLQDTMHSTPLYTPTLHPFTP